jgi:hypothetical protein
MKREVKKGGGGKTEGRRWRYKRGGGREGGRERERSKKEGGEGWGEREGGHFVVNVGVVVIELW